MYLINSLVLSVHTLRLSFRNRFPALMTNDLKSTLKKRTSHC